jgi:hypothetical protein
MNNPELEKEARRATDLLRGKVVRVVWRHRANEIGLEFDDGTRLFVDVGPNGELDVSITGGASDSND